MGQRQLLMMACECLYSLDTEQKQAFQLNCFVHPILSVYVHESSPKLTNLTTTSTKQTQTNKHTLLGWLPWTILP